MDLENIPYTRHEYLAGPEERTGALLTLLYDIPYFGACGIFPPLHILNQILLSGGGDGGMSPGASWEPFSISEAEYATLIELVRFTPVSEIRPFARYAFVGFRFDSSFDHMQHWPGWMKAVCNRHRDQWHRELRRAGVMR